MQKVTLTAKRNKESTYYLETTSGPDAKDFIDLYARQGQKFQITVWDDAGRYVQHSGKEAMTVLLNLIERDLKARREAE